jgi:hypothetical protein
VGEDIAISTAIRVRGHRRLAGRAREATFTWDRTAAQTVESYRRLF